MCCLCVLLVHLELPPPHLGFHEPLALLLLPLLLYYVLKEEQLLSVVGELVVRAGAFALTLVCLIVVRLVCFVVGATL